MRRWLDALLGVGPEVQARRARNVLSADRARLLAANRLESVAFTEAMAHRALRPHVTLGTAEEETALRVGLDALDGAHGWVSGATGSGKTRLVGAFLGALVRAALGGAPLAVVVVALQGNLAELVLRDLGTLVATRRAPIMDRLLTARFFRGTHLPPWNLLARTPEVGALAQGSALAEVLENALGAPLGSRQETALAMLLAGAIENELTLQALRTRLVRPESVTALAARCSDPVVAAYLRERFVREGQGTLEGIASRLDRMLALDAGLRGALAAPTRLDLSQVFTPGMVSVFDFSETPLGAEGARRALSALVVQSLAAAALSATRRVRTPTVIVLDEAQLAFTPATVRTLETLLTTVRQFRVGLWFVNQSLVQLPREFVQLLSTNTRYRVIGLSGREDALLSREYLPRTGRVPRPRPPWGLAPTEGFLSASEELERRVQELGALPRRTFLYHERSAPFGARRFLARSFDPSAWESLPTSVQEGLERGAVGEPRAALARRAARLDEELRASLDAAPAVRPLSRSRSVRAQPVHTPDVVATGLRWSRRTPR